MSLGGGGGGTRTQTVRQVADPSSAEINRLLAGQIRGVTAETGGFAPFARFQPLTQPTQPELDILSRIAGFADRPAVNPLETAGLLGLAGAADPTSRLAAARQSLETVAAPQIINTLTAAGLGRSGAIGEAIGRAGSELTLPILQDVAQAQQTAGRAALSFGPLVESRELERLNTALSATEAPRLLALQEQLRPLEILSSLFGRFLPQGASGGQIVSERTSQSILPALLGFGLLGLSGRR